MPKLDWTWDNYCALFVEIVNIPPQNQDIDKNMICLYYGSLLVQSFYIHPSPFQRFFTFSKTIFVLQKKNGSCSRCPDRDAGLVVTPLGKEMLSNDVVGLGLLGSFLVDTLFTPSGS